ncbi:MAG: hypothetical protein AB1894_27335 [Chloroflexota bacterium]
MNPHHRFLLSVCLVLWLGLGCSLPVLFPDDLAEATAWATPVEATAASGSQSGVPLGPLCPGAYPVPVTDLAVRQYPALAEPKPRIPFRDPIFNTCLVRVTDRHADLSPEDDSSGLKNEYARVQSFNADGTRLLARSLEAFWYLYDARTLRPLAPLPLGAEPRWDAQNPDVIYYNDETRLMSYNLKAGEAGLVHDFAADFPGQTLSAVWTRYEGRPSMDSRYWGLVAEDAEWLPVAFVVYDRFEDQVIARDVRSLPGIQEDVDHVTISPKGTYFLASFDRYCEHDQLGDDAHPCGLMVYDHDLQNGRGLLRIIGHYDAALDADGREVLVFQDIDNDSVSMLDLQSGQVTALWPIDFSHTPLGFHFSGLAYQRPGWALVSTYSGGAQQAYTWMDNQVFAIELKAGGRVARLAHTHAIVDENQEHDYWAEPQASVNPDFTRILFASNWGRTGTQEIEMYMIELSSDWISQLPADSP